MRIVIGVLLLAAAVGAQTITPQPASTMSELMVKIIYPASDAIFYITTREPKTEAEWGDLQGKALAVAESANLLMMPGRARDQDRWMQDAKLMLDAGRAAFRAAKAKDVAALDALNDQLYTSCTSCHSHYRSNYGRRPSPAASPSAPDPARPAVPAVPAVPAARRETLHRAASVTGRPPRLVGSPVARQPGRLAPWNLGTLGEPAAGRGSSGRPPIPGG